MCDPSRRYVTADALQVDSFTLADQVVRSGWQPSVLLSVWRGGVPVGLAIDEYLSIRGIAVSHRVVQAQSYQGIERRGEVRIADAESLVASLAPDARILVADDILDSGRTLTALRTLLGTASREVRVAVVYWRSDRSSACGAPDYFCHSTDRWVVFPHELVGLKPEDWHKKGPAIQHLLESEHPRQR